jgi:ATPase subunit of ABC transporter with duplicated ATPase domains
MLLSNANLLILDEPTNHLDLTARAFLQEALHHFDGGVLLASHDRHFAAHLATRLIALDPADADADHRRVRVTEESDYPSYLAARPLTPTLPPTLTLTPTPTPTLTLTLLEP